MARSNWVPYMFEWGKLLQSHLMGKTCSNWLNNFLYEKKFTPGGCLPLARGYIHVYHHYFRTSSLKSLDQSTPNFILSLRGKGEESLYKWSRSHDQDGRHAHIWQKPSKIFYRTNSPMVMKLGMEHYVLKLYKVYINDAPELTLTHFMTISNFAKLVFVLIVGPDIRCFISVQIKPNTAKIGKFEHPKHFYNCPNMSPVMRNLFMPYANNKGVD